MRLELIQAPATEPVTLTEAKAHLRVSGASEDAWITDAITGARGHVEDLTRRRLITQKWRVYFDCFPGQGWLDWRHWRYSEFVLPDLAPVSAIDNVKYIDVNGALQTLDPVTYQLVAESPARLTLAYAQSWPGIRGDREGVRVEATCGYGAAGAVPKRFKQAVYLMLAHWYEHREEVADFQTYPLPVGVENMLSPFMVSAF